jgi:hypothetical protein
MVTKLKMMSQTLDRITQDCTKKDILYLQIASTQNLTYFYQICIPVQHLTKEILRCSNILKHLDLILADKDFSIHDIEQFEPASSCSASNHAPFLHSGLVNPAPSNQVPSKKTYVRARLHIERSCTRLSP